MVVAPSQMDKVLFTLWSVIRIPMFLHFSWLPLPDAWPQWGQHRQKVHPAEWIWDQHSARAISCLCAAHHRSGITIVLTHVVQTELIQQLTQLCTPPVFDNLVISSTAIIFPFHGQFTENRRFLGRYPIPSWASFIHRQFAMSSPSRKTLPSSGLIRPTTIAESGGFIGPVWPQQTHNFALVYFYRHCLPRYGYDIVLLSCRVWISLINAKRFPGKNTVTNSNTFSKQVILTACLSYWFLVYVCGLINNQWK